MSVPDATQNGAPPPPPQPTGSPFGRFLTQPVFLVALLALIVAAPIVALALKGDEGGSAAAPTEARAILGDWSGPATARNAAVPVDVELTIRSLSGSDAGTLTRGRCSGALASRGKTGRGYVFAYEEQADAEGCPRRATVVVEPLRDDRLRFVERRGGRIVAEGVLDEA